MILFKAKFAILFLFLSAFSCSETIRGKVIYVSDGDTFQLLKSDGSKAKVRVADIDCPETVQAYGLEAKEYVINEIRDKEVTIRVKEVDRYGRLVARVYYEGKDLSEELVRHGFAWHYEAYSDDPKLERLEKEAQKKKIGLWQDRNPIAPWEFRKKRNRKKQSNQKTSNNSVDKSQSYILI